MSTSALIDILDSNGETITTIYKHWDGYPEDLGVGRILQSFLADIKIVNGISTTKNVANGMECLAAQVIAHLKEGPGDVYIYPPNTRDLNEEYIYTIQEVNNKPVVNWKEV